MNTHSISGVDAFSLSFISGGNSSASSEAIVGIEKSSVLSGTVINLPGGEIEKDVLASSLNSSSASIVEGFVPKKGSSPWIKVEDADEKLRKRPRVNLKLSLGDFREFFE